MAKLLVLYRAPKDPSVFERYYRDTHIPLVKKISGLRKLETSKGPVNAPGGGAPYHFVATLEFDSMEALGGALGSPEGQAAAADVGNFADGGADLLFFETQTV